MGLSNKWRRKRASSNQFVVTVSAVQTAKAVTTNDIGKAIVNAR
jgi:hypothetical protein